MIAKQADNLPLLILMAALYGLLVAVITISFVFKMNFRARQAKRRPSAYCRPMTRRLRAVAIAVYALNMALLVLSAAYADVSIVLGWVPWFVFALSSTARLVGQDGDAYYYLDDARGNPVAIEKPQCIREGGRAVLHFKTMGKKRQTLIQFNIPLDDAGRFEADT